MEIKGQKRYMESIFDPNKIDEIKAYLFHVIRQYRQPSGSELLRELENTFGWKIRWSIFDIINDLINDKMLTRREKEFFDFIKHSTTSAGFATLVRGEVKEKMRILIHNELDEPSKFGVLCHELAHIFVGHLGSERDRWWPSRQNLTHDSVEIEAEAVAYTITQRLGLKGSSEAYLSA